MLFLSAIQALRKSHALGYIVLDLKAENILFDETTGSSYLIDGGLSTKTGAPIPHFNFNFKKMTHTEIKISQKDCPQFAPECFNVFLVT